MLTLRENLQSQQKAFEYFAHPKETNTLNNVSYQTTCQSTWRQNSISEILSPQPHWIKPRHSKPKKTFEIRERFLKLDTFALHQHEHNKKTIFLCFAVACTKSHPLFEKTFWEGYSFVVKGRYFPFTLSIANRYNFTKTLLFLLKRTLWWFKTALGRWLNMIFRFKHIHHDICILRKTLTFLVVVSFKWRHWERL